MAPQESTCPATGEPSARAVEIWREWQRLVLVRTDLDCGECSAPWVRREVAGDAGLLSASCRISGRIAELLQELLALPRGDLGTVAVQFYVYCAIGRAGEDGEDVPAVIVREMACSLAERMPEDFRRAFLPFGDPDLSSSQALVVSETIRRGDLAVECVRPDQGAAPQNA